MPPGFADEQLAEFLADLNRQRLAAPAETDPAAMRAASEQRAAARPKGPEMHAVRNLVARPGGRPARLYRPTRRATSLVLFLHGGGWSSATWRPTTALAGAWPPAPAPRCWRSTTAARL